MKEIEVEKQLPVILMNFDEVKLSLNDTMNKYKGIVVTEESLKKCKATQKDLAKLRNNIDSYRKNVKKEMEKPIREFESQCRDLIKLISEVEKPIKDGIKIYDDKRREEKRLKAIEYIKESIRNHKLKEEYASKLTIKEQYLNLSGTLKSIKEDIEMRAAILEKQQEDDREKRLIFEVSIRNAINSVNRDIKTKLTMDDFTYYIELGWPLDKILKEINDRAETILKAEKTVQYMEKNVQAKNNENEREKIDNDIKLSQDNVKYFVNIDVIHNYEMIKSLSKYLKENGYKYNVKEKRVIK
ncbi:DUF1351 domain-containing protein [Clostridium sardiniense]|uniref:DUF1351 domain-containing protein n=1 Tax=Clostridium sardiniense TaxID=29369 RepID=UPI001956972F|nr:DUF1351 domain-containing protein [Clostridium sardiniense]MBM7835056.1 uncharacterized membrane-anchored protein YhcB (DUF1043 family) [Clostridium sardiniense]